MGSGALSHSTTRKRFVDACRGRQGNGTVMGRVQGNLAHKTTTPKDPTVGLCLGAYGGPSVGAYGGPSGGAVS